jgi:hypothetical protein
MQIKIEHFPGKYPQFNVSLASQEGKEPFIVIKGCRIVDGSKGPFVSWPSRRQEDGKYWNHVWASEGFAAAVLKEAQKGAAKPAPKAPSLADMDNDVPF